LKEGRCALSAAFSSYLYMIMYGQVETINQIVNAYFFVTFSEWCWVFMDGFWVVTMAFTLPFAAPAKKLSNERPTSSVLGTYTLASAFGVLIINFCFLCIALGALWAQPWFQCRKWTSIDVSNATLIGDNYESSVIWLVSGFQYVGSAMAFNFGFKHRAPWLFNWRFAYLCLSYCIIHLVVAMVPSDLSCFFRVNCDDNHLQRFATNSELIPIQNNWHTTIMPVEFRRVIVGIIIGNTVAVMMWEYFVVHGWVGAQFRKRYPRMKHIKL